MIKRILKMAATGFVYFAIATVVAQGIMFTYSWFAWDMTWQRAQDTLAVAKGEVNIETPLDLEKLEEEITEERPSFQDILQARALKTRDFELRDEALSQAKGILHQQQDSYLQELETLNVAKNGFERQVTDFETRSQGEGLEQNIAMISGIDTSLAKIQLLNMYNNDQKEDLINIIKGMEPQKCVEIMDEFKTKEDEKALADILRRIRDGFEFEPPIDNTVGNLPPQT